MAASCPGMMNGIGQGHSWENPPRDFSSVKREFREKSSFIAYRYCPDLAQRAREFAAEHFADFVRFHGSDLALFPDGLSAAAAEQKRLRVSPRSRLARIWKKS
jgi:hypothetical protein